MRSGLRKIMQGRYLLEQHLKGRGEFDLVKACVIREGAGGTKTTKCLLKDA